jgi:hypothetical protein
MLSSLPQGEIHLFINVTDDKYKYLGYISGSNGEEHEDASLLGCCAM